MHTCRSIDCSQTAQPGHDYCADCIDIIVAAVGQSAYDAIQREQGRSAPSVKMDAMTAPEILAAAKGHMEDRAVTYDSLGGERSMGKTVAAFNAVTGLQLSETQGWLFMTLLKIVRSTQGDYHADNYEDLTAYSALAGESAAREAQKVSA